MRLRPTNVGSWIPPDFDMAKFTEELQAVGASTPET
jgi:hypothetical protein